jgi:ArsR family transcriptional regulator, arsenate/arsenite/antimonite-responsive transcriptional repressor
VEPKIVIRALAALAQETRLRIFRLLVQAGPTGMSAGEIGAELKIVPATLSFHLKEMSHAELVAGRQEGRFIFYSANFDQMGALVAYLTRNCCTRDGTSCVPIARTRPSCAAGASKSKSRGVKA